MPKLKKPLRDDLFGRGEFLQISGLTKSLAKKVLRHYVGAIYHNTFDGADEYRELPNSRAFGRAFRWCRCWVVHVNVPACKRSKRNKK